jgi:hypothetical protein
MLFETRFFLGWDEAVGGGGGIKTHMAVVVLSVPEQLIAYLMSARTGFGHFFWTL